jgi:hypothetical protein
MCWLSAGQVTYHFVPAIALGKQAQGAFIGGTAMAAQVRGIHAVTGITQGLGQARIAAAVLGHAMGQHHQRLVGVPSGSHWLTYRRLRSFAVSQKVVWFMALPLLRCRCSV